MYKHLIRAKYFILIPAVAFVLLGAGIYRMYVSTNKKSEVIYKSPTEETLKRIRMKNKLLSQGKTTANKSELTSDDVGSDTQKEITEKPLGSGIIKDDNVAYTSKKAISNGENVKVSPYGFGPYPELPDKWPSDYWDKPMSREHEIIGRVRIKLYNEGKWAEGVTMNHQSGLVYPIYKDTVYVRWGAYTDNNGQTKRFITSSQGHPETIARIRGMQFPDKLPPNGESILNYVSIDESDIPSDIKLVSYEDGGIDPIKYLGLE